MDVFFSVYILWKVFYANFYLSFFSRKNYLNKWEYFFSVFFFILFYFLL